MTTKKLDPMLVEILRQPIVAETNEPALKVLVHRTIEEIKQTNDGQLRGQLLGLLQARQNAQAELRAKLSSEGERTLEILMALVLTEPVAPMPVDARDELLDKPFTELLILTVRIEKMLKADGVKTLRDVLTRREYDLIRLGGFGRSALDTLRSAVNAWGFVLGQFYEEPVVEISNQPRLYTFSKHDVEKHPYLGKDYRTQQMSWTAQVLTMNCGVKVMGDYTDITRKEFVAAGEGWQDVDAVWHAAEEIETLLANHGFRFKPEVE